MDKIFSPDILQPLGTLLALVPGLFSYNAAANAPSAGRTTNTVRENITLATVGCGIATLASGFMELFSGQGIGPTTVNFAIATIGLQVGRGIGNL